MGKKEYIKANQDWLEAKAQEEGVMPLPKGVFYKVIKSSGTEKTGQTGEKHPGPRSIVTVHYTGRTNDGKVFDTSEGDIPVALRMNELIDGWVIALQEMSIGDKWEIYLPANMGYGKFSQPGIPGGSTLIFEIELLGIAM